MDKTKRALVTMLTVADAGLCVEQNGEPGDHQGEGIEHEEEQDGVVLVLSSGRRIRVRFEDA